MRVVISGVSGLVGGALARSLRDDGHDVVGISRTPAPDTVVWDLDAGTIDVAALEGADAIVHLAGESIQGRWTAAKKERIMRSRVESTRLLADAVAAMDRPPGVFVCGSAIHFYGDRGDERLDETSSPGGGFLGEVVRAWEDAARPIADAGVRLAFARTAVVLDPDDGALPRMALITKVGAGGPIGGGDQYLSWITLHDQVRALRHIIDSDLSGPVNLAAPGAVPQGEFARALASALHRPAVVPTPGFAIRTALGEMGDELLLYSIRVEPAALVDSGFEFDHPDVAAAFADLYAERGDVNTSVEIDRSDTATWAALEDIASHVDWMRDAAEIRFVGDQRSGVGTRFECDTKVGPLSTTDVMEVTAWEPGVRMAVEHSGAVSGSGEFTLHRLGDDRTELRWSESLRFPWYFGGPVGAVMARPILRRIWQGNLRRFADGLD